MTIKICAAQEVMNTVLKLTKTKEREWSVVK